jgi:hypothetical protein
MPSSVRGKDSVMSDLMNYLLYGLAIVAGAILYAIGYESAKSFIEYVRDHGLDLGRERRVNLTGTWYAAWQTTAKGKEVLNTELLRIKQRRHKIIIENLEISPENKLGGYLWKGEASLYNNQYLIGRYLPVDPNVISKGSLFFRLDRVRKYLQGKWVGCNVDHELTWGFGVIAKEKNDALSKLKELCRLRRY